MPEKTFAVEIAAADDGAVRPWRKWLLRLDEEQPRGKACVGDWLEPGGRYELPVGAVVVGCDPLPGGERKRVRVWRVIADGQLKEERDSTLRNANAFGASVRGTLRRLLEKHPAAPGQVARQVAAAPPRVNDRADTCWLCRQPVAARAGVLVRQGGRSRPQHRPGQCPPRPPRHNEWAQSCGKCGGWLEAEEGVLYDAGGGVVPVTRARHPEACPSAAERKHPPPRTNRQAQECERCGQVVPAGGGELLGGPGAWTVRHRSGQCPPCEELWEIGRGKPGRFHPRPERWAAPGTVLRTELFEPEHHPFPQDAPGYRRLDEHRVTAIVTTVRERRPVYYRDEDGNNPGDLLGEDGWHFRILVRPATPAEAAEILAQEEKAARRHALERRLEISFAFDQADCLIPDTPDLTGTTPVDFGARERRSLHQHWPDDKVLLDEAAGVVWFLRYNGADGDTWSASNVPGFIAARFPLTEERRAVIADLDSEYRSPSE